MYNKRFVLPFVLPVASFVLAVAAGAALLWWDASQHVGHADVWDAIFMSTSAVCVTGLSTVDAVSTYSGFGMAVMLALMQLGGLGIITYSTLLFFILSRKISLTDRLAVGQALLSDQSFHLGFFVRRIVLVVLGMELAGAALLYVMEPERIGGFNALFLAVSSFCNAGFAPWSDNLMGWQQHNGVNLVVMSLIVFGGLGFAVLDECLRHLWHRLRYYTALPSRRPFAPKPRPLSFQAKLVIRTSLALVFAGAGIFFLFEYFVNSDDFFDPSKVILPAFFQSVTSRTAGFNTVNIGKLTDVTLLVLIGLMFIGGSSGSCAGGIKTGTFRVLAGMVKSTLQGNSQVTVAGKGVSYQVVNKALTLLIFAIITVVAGTFMLTLTEGGFSTHGKTPFQVLDLFFETVSAFATVGLTTGVTPSLSDPGKFIVSLLMFIGRLGPIWLVTTIQQFQSDKAYRLPENDVSVG